MHGDSIFERGLGRNPANHAPLTPIDFLRWAAEVYPDRTAVVHGDARYTYREFEDRCRRLASALMARGIGPGDTVAVMAPNIPALLEAHYGVPMTGAVLNALNTRLDAGSVAFILGHGEAGLLIADQDHAAVVGEALAAMDSPPPLIRIDDPVDKYLGVGCRASVSRRPGAPLLRRSTALCP